MNKVINGKGFYISYNPMVGETALVKDGKRIMDFKFYILMGDYTDEYEKLVPKGYKICKAFFDDRVKKGHKVSAWSN